WRHRDSSSSSRPRRGFRSFGCDTSGGRRILLRDEACRIRGQSTPCQPIVRLSAGRRAFETSCSAFGTTPDFEMVFRIHRFCTTSSLLHPETGRVPVLVSEPFIVQLNFTSLHLLGVVLQVGQQV